MNPAYFIVLIFLLQACSTTSERYVENSPEEGMSLIYIHSDCLGNRLRNIGRKVFLDGNLTNNLLDSGYLEIPVVPGEHGLRIEFSGSEDASLKFLTKPNERIYIMYSSYRPRRSEMGILVHAMKGTKDKTNLHIYPESYAASTMKNCMKIENEI